MKEGQGSGSYQQPGASHQAIKPALDRLKEQSPDWVNIVAKELLYSSFQN
jgi:hypothetical protein